MGEGPTIRQLTYFLAAVEHGSLSSAAEHQHVAQPSLSDQVRRLERELGAPLFIRTNRMLKLTDIGRALIPLAQRTIRAAEAVSEAATEMTTLSGGTVSFGTFSSAHRYLLTPLIAEFNATYPQVRIRNVGLNSAEVVEAVREGRLEAGLVQLPVDDYGVRLSEPVLTDTVVYVSSNPTHTERPVTIEDLGRSRLILSEARWEREDPLRRSIAERARQAGVTISPLVEVEFQDAAMSLAVHGVGDTLVSYLVARFHEQMHQVTWAPLEPLFEERFAFVTAADGAMSPATRRFLALARKHVVSLQGHASRWMAEYTEGHAPEG
jgi:DNA-binding transcriptional LysR family regulator